MKKLLISMVAIAFIVPSITSASIDANLKYGSRGMEVTELQEFLIDKGFLTGQTSGNFFALTRKAVVAWQASIGLPATGFVGSMSRAKINEDLSTANASAVSAEVAETGTTLTQTQTISSSASFTSGCTSTAGFSTTTGKPCSVSVAVQNTTANKTITFPNGSVAEIDSRGDVVRWIKEAIVAAQSSIQSTEIQISSINITPTNNSARIEWQTSKPAESKLFLSGGGLVPKVYNSEFGNSTRHSVSVGNLKGDTNYSYEIEVIFENNSYKNNGDFITKSSPLPTFNITKEPVPGPSWPGWNTFKINSTNGTFVIEAITIEIADPETVVSPTTREGFVNRNGDYRRCDAINDAYIQWQSRSYPYPCPVSSNNPIYLAKSNPTWKNERMSISLSSQTIFPPGTEIFYYKAVEGGTGKVFEFQK